MVKKLVGRQLGSHEKFEVEPNKARLQGGVNICWLPGVGCSAQGFMGRGSRSIQNLHFRVWGGRAEAEEDSLLLVAWGYIILTHD